MTRDNFDVFTMTGRLPSGKRILPALGLEFDDDGVVKKRCRHIIDDSPGMGLHCVKCGYKPKRRR